MESKRVASLDTQVARVDCSLFRYTDLLNTSLLRDNLEIASDTAIGANCPCGTFFTGPDLGPEYIRYRACRTGLNACAASNTS